jgi:preprotein translocase subunit SecY
MLSAFVNCFRIPEVRKRILFTLGMIVIIRLGAAIPVPGINAPLLREYFDSIVNTASSNSVVGLVNIFSGGALENCAIFSLGIMPYISASIMIQLMTIVIPQLGKMAREEGGRQKITQYTRYVTLILCVIQGWLLAQGFLYPDKNPFLSGIDDVIRRTGQDLVLHKDFTFSFFVILTNTAGTLLLMWLGEQITERGIGNGISVVITVGIAARLPAAIAQAWQKFVPSGGNAAELNPFLLVLLIAFMIIVVAGVVAITQATRRVSIQYAKRQVGRQMYQTPASYLPLKVNYSGVMPIIFAQTILMFPGFLLGFIPNPGATLQWFTNSLSHGTLHYVMYALMILFFSYFWVATQFNPIQISDDLKKAGGFVPGVRPGQPTAEFLDFTMTRLTLAGAIFLMVLAILPQLMSQSLGVPSLTAQFFGGTSLLIIVGVMLDTMRQLETYLLQKQYDGFLKKGRVKARTNLPQGAQNQAPSNDTLVWIGLVVAVIVIAGIVGSIVRK